MDLLIWVEQTAYGTWLRESPSMWAFPVPLVLHAIGMAFLVGMSAALDFRILGWRHRTSSPYARHLPDDLRPVEDPDESPSPGTAYPDVHELLSLWVHVVVHA